MTYYIIEGEKNPVDIKLGQYKENIETSLKKEETIILYYDSNIQKLETPILHFQGYIFVNTQVKKVLELYETEMSFKQVVFLDCKVKVSKYYWMILLSPLDCLSTKAKVGFDQSIKELVLKQSRIKGKNIVIVSMVKDTHNPHIRKALVVSLAVAESLLRRKIVGIICKELKVERGE